MIVRTDMHYFIAKTAHESLVCGQLAQKKRRWTQTTPTGIAFYERQLVHQEGSDKND